MVAAPVLAAGSQAAVAVDLGDGEPPVATRAQVVWTRTMAGGPDEPAGLALRFLDIPHEAVVRIARLVRERTPAASSLLRRKVRVRMPGLPSALRAFARDVDDETVMVEAELPWLKLGSAVQAELSENDVRNGRLRWVGVDVGPSGGACLRLAIDVSGRTLLSETPDEAAFFAKSAAPKESKSVETYELSRKPRRMFAVAIGVVLGCAIGGGAMEVQKHPQLLGRLLDKLTPAARTIHIPDDPPIVHRHVRAIPTVPAQ